ncbi:uncharacterized protein LOC113237328 [Hyposmocoma kahamanoa]|uniref:uncharacterized protein LOC113237328 n=1 Tax=Hyposmocoma kahamanoa TaxID=1477025 RepID=UPI000E6D8A03|nr:uncharacterized protein LOC113237328 [Hyposmocoma kahamanoa]
MSPINEHKKSPSSTGTTTDYNFFEEYETPRKVNITVMLKGQNPIQQDLLFFAYFDGQIMAEEKWQHELEIDLPIFLNLKDYGHKYLIAETPLLFIVRALTGSKAGKDPDPLAHVDNKAGGALDLLPLLIGEDEIYIKVRLISVETGDWYHGLKVVVHAETIGQLDHIYYPLIITMISAHCLPNVKDGTFYVGAIGLDILEEPVTVNFGLALSHRDAKKTVWAAVSTAGVMANSAYNAPDEDKFVPYDLNPQDLPQCNSVYWNAVKRILITDQSAFRKRLLRHFPVEIAGVPRIGKIDVRGRYTALVDVGVLLEPGQDSLISCAKLKYYSALPLGEGTGPLLVLPPSSTKNSARDRDPASAFVVDERGHNAYVVVQFNLMEPVIPKQRLYSLFETIGFPAPEGPRRAHESTLHMEPLPEDPLVDARKIRLEEGALAVHKELSGMTCTGAVSMNQGIKRTAANKLMMRIRTMLKQFAPGECSYLDWQDTVTRQHATARRAVTASFAPQPPQPRMTQPYAAARCRMASDTRIAEYHISHNLEVSPEHPRPLLSKALRCLEQRYDSDAKKYIVQGLSSLVMNKYLLWMYGGIEYDKGEEALERAIAALQIACKGEHSDGTSNAIAFAALHTVLHYGNRPYGAFVAAKRMRKSYELQKEWPKFLKRWLESSGEEEIYWVPSVIRSDNPMLIAAAFFLCLRCYKLSEQILQCMENGCATLGSRFHLETIIFPDLYYLRAVSFLMRNQVDQAKNIIAAGIKKLGPCAMLTQIHATCLKVERGWDAECEHALINADRFGAEIPPALLLQSAMSHLKKNPDIALQRAARAHRLAPSAHTAFTIGLCYARMGDYNLSERWFAVSVKVEPLLADGWAMLAVLAMRQRDVDKARAMLRTAHQAGPLSDDVKFQVSKMMSIIKIETLSDSMLKNLCLCDYLIDKLEA